MARRGENIHKRKDGRWEGRYIKARTQEGKIQWGYVYGTAYAEVKRVLIQKKAEAGFYNLKRTDLTFEALAEVWLHSLKNGIKESTYAHYSYTLHKYLLPVLSKVPIASLEESFLEQAMQQIIAPIDAAHKPLGNSSARECLSMLRRICKYAAHLRLIRPMELEVALPKAIDKISVPLSPAEQQRLYQYVQENPTPRKIGLLLGVELGLRIGEICGLQWGDFDLKLGTLKISRTVCRISCGNGHTKVVIQTPKTHTSRREIPIPKQLLIMLKKLRGCVSNATWFLSGNESKPTEPRCYRKSIKAYLKQSTVRQVRPHALRHTFATTCLQAGCDVKTLSELSGRLKVPRLSFASAVGLIVPSAKYVVTEIFFTFSERLMPRVKSAEVPSSMQTVTSLIEKLKIRSNAESKEFNGAERSIPSPFPEAEAETYSFVAFEIFIHFSDRTIFPLPPETNMPSSLHESVAREERIFTVFTVAQTIFPVTPEAGLPAPS